MKYLKSIDWAGQSVIWVAFIVGSLLSIASGEGFGAIGYIGLLCQLFMGCWQMVSAVLFLLLGAEPLWFRKTHFISAFMCLALISLSAWLEHESDSITTDFLFLVFGVIVPWLLAIFYYSITWRWMFPKRHNGKFLSHISF
jgi:hypothetical protein